MRLLRESITYRFPSGSNATPKGRRKRVSAAGSCSSSSIPSSPVPTTVANVTGAEIHRPDCTVVRVGEVEIAVRPELEVVGRGEERLAGLAAVAGVAHVAGAGECIDDARRRDPSPGCDWPRCPRCRACLRGRRCRRSGSGSSPRPRRTRPPRPDRRPRCCRGCRCRQWCRSCRWRRPFGCAHSADRRCRCCRLRPRWRRSAA